MKFFSFKLALTVFLEFGIRFEFNITETFKTLRL